MYKLQAGVALLQVLLISTAISLLAIRFTLTAQDQIEVTYDIEQRVKAQLEARSVLNEVLLLELSESVRDVSSLDALAVNRELPLKADLNRYGVPIQWNENTEVVIQDLNGLLPQIFPSHVLWKKLLLRSTLSESAVDRYLGTWMDVQDHDIISWDKSGEESVSLPSGGAVINGYTQNDKVARWIFSEDPELLEVVLAVSDVNATYDTNIFNAPKLLLNSIFEPSIASYISLGRRDGTVISKDAAAFLSSDYLFENIYSHNSNRINVTVRVSISDSEWVESLTINLDSDSSPPFKILLRN